MISYFLYPNYDYPFKSLSCTDQLTNDNDYLYTIGTIGTYIPTFSLMTYFNWVTGHGNPQKPVPIKYDKLMMYE